MILYHGSHEIIQQPVFGLGSAQNDYGRGFYCTQSIELAKEWACPMAGDGFANQYELDLDGLSVLDLSRGGYHILNWVAILLQNRTFLKRSPIAHQAEGYILREFLPDISGFDVICGYRADDAYFAYAKDFLNNTISIRQLSQAMRLGELGEQVFLISRLAFEQVHFTGYEIADAEVYFRSRSEREERARAAYLNRHGADFAVSDQDLFVRDILQQEVRNDDPRLS